MTTKQSSCHHSHCKSPSALLALLISKKYEGLGLGHICEPDGTTGEGAEAAAPCRHTNPRSHWVFLEGLPCPQHPFLSRLTRARTPACAPLGLQGLGSLPCLEQIEKTQDLESGRLELSSCAIQSGAGFTPLKRGFRPHSCL